MLRLLFLVAPATEIMLDSLDDGLGLGQGDGRYVWDGSRCENFLHLNYKVSKNIILSMSKNIKTVSPLGNMRPKLFMNCE